MFRTRFAPSPTGRLHVGGARTALLNWLLARHHGGSFVLRIEDTDLERNVAGAEEALLEDLRWLGLDWDEGPGVGGPSAPYRQSERGDLYLGLAERLLEDGNAYRCSCPPQAEGSGETRPRCRCAEGGVARGVGESVRLRVPETEPIEFHDLIRGDIVYPPGSVEDFVLLRSDGRPTYNFAAAADDAAMRISHVVRGSDHLANTPKQLLLYRALGWDPPHFAHIPLILGPDRQKLSKRHGATSVAEHRRLGYLHEALVNYLSLLSWSSPSGEELLPMDRLVAEVDLDRVGASDAVFDREKLEWLSGQYIQRLPSEELLARVLPFLDRERNPIDDERLPLAVEAIRKRITLLSEADRELAAFTGPRTPAQRSARERVLSESAPVRVLQEIRKRLEALPEWSVEGIDAAVREGGRVAGVRGKALFLPLRLALSGEEHGPELAKIIAVLGRERAIRLLGGG